MNWLKNVLVGFYVNNEAVINKLLIGLVCTVVGALGHRYGFDPRVVEKEPQTAMPKGMKMGENP